MSTRTSAPGLRAPAPLSPLRSLHPLPPNGPRRPLLSHRPLRAAVALGLGLATGCAQDQNIVKLEGDDVFYQVDAGEVDVLLVVDNSGSMQPYQDLLSENFNAFLTYFIEGNVDYHIGVVTTSMEPPAYFAGSGCTQDDIDAVPLGGHLKGGTWITPETDDGDALFRELVEVGTCGSGYEMGLESAYAALTSPLIDDENEGFIREDAYLSVIFVSDEQDASPWPVDDYVNGFRDVKGQRDRDSFNASALVVADLEDCSTRQVASGAHPGTRYLDVATQTDGVVGNICADDFGVIVEELSLASSRLTDTFYLNEDPDPTSIVVGVDDAIIDCADGVWTFARVPDGPEGRPAIVFARDQLPPPNSKINVQYNYGGGDPAGFCE
jgi:hypothetical protein